MKRLHPFGYYGGKYMMLALLMLLMPAHSSYAEVFGGSGTFLINKPPAETEIYNDINSDVVNFFRCLRNEPNELLTLLKFTPYSREEFDACLNNISFEKCDLERARKFYMAQAMSFAGKGKVFSWTSAGHNKMTTLKNKIEVLREISGRLKNVMLENISFEKLITRTIKKMPDAFIYCDPPYLPEVRKSSGDYKYEMTGEQHVQLLDLILSNESKAKFLISGYSSELYESKLKGWNRVEKIVPLSCNVNKFGKHNLRTEVLWFNYGIKNENVQKLAKLVSNTQIRLNEN